MGKTITEKIIETHLVSGPFLLGEEIAIRIDQTLTQDATGTMAYLQFEYLNIQKVMTDLSVSYVDHNTIQIGFENADDHRYLQTVAQKYGIYFSRPGNGICHQVHLERFGKPGKTLLGSDSHTPTAGALGMLAIGAGGLDVALAMAGEPFYLTCRGILRINLVDQLPPWTSAKDIILKILQMFSARGNKGYIFEYGGEGLSHLSVPERATIANMGAECGVITSVFPSDEMTRNFLKAQAREEDWIELKADDGASYERVVNIDLSRLVPLAACPHSPDNVRPVREVGEIEVDQVCIGSCTNSSYRDLALVASILKGKTVHPSVNFVISPGSRQVIENLARDGYLLDLIKSGARIMESACGFCIGNSQSPRTKGVSVRTSNRNFRGRSGTMDADVYLVSPETAAATVITGRLTDPRDLGIDYPRVTMPERFHIDDSLIIPPSKTVTTSSIEVYRGPNIGTLPESEPFPDRINGIVTIKVGNNITTDHIIPAGDLMKYRSNISKYSEYLFKPIDTTFFERARRIQREGLHNVVVAGHSYGQGSSREHAALCVMYVGVKIVIAKSIERIHMDNLVNFGILPVFFVDETMYERIEQGDTLETQTTEERLRKCNTIEIKVPTKGFTFLVHHNLTERQLRILRAGGALALKRSL